MSIRVNDTEFVCPGFDRQGRSERAGLTRQKTTVADWPEVLPVGLILPVLGALCRLELLPVD